MSTRWRKMLGRAAVWAATAAAGAFLFGALSGLYQRSELPLVVGVWALFAAVVALASDPRLIPDRDDER